MGFSQRQYQDRNKSGLDCRNIVWYRYCWLQLPGKHVTQARQPNMDQQATLGDKEKTVILDRLIYLRFQTKICNNHGFFYQNIYSQILLYLVIHQKIFQQFLKVLPIDAAIKGQYHKRVDRKRIYVVLLQFLALAFNFEKIN